MTNDMRPAYVAPSVETAEVVVESGFAASELWGSDSFIEDPFLRRTVRTYSSFDSICDYEQAFIGMAPDGRSGAVDGVFER